MVSCRAHRVAMWPQPVSQPMGEATFFGRREATVDQPAPKTQRIPHDWIARDDYGSSILAAEDRRCPIADRLILPIYDS